MIDKEILDNVVEQMKENESGILLDTSDLLLTTHFRSEGSDVLDLPGIIISKMLDDEPVFFTVVAFKDEAAIDEMISALQSLKQSNSNESE